MTARSLTRGLTLLEVMVSVGILSLVGMLIFGALSGMSNTRESLSRVNDRYQQGRQALSRMTRELQSAFLSLHQPYLPNQIVRTTLFLGEDSHPIDRLDFVSFSHRRLDRDVHESDQNEVTYFASRDPNINSKLDLARREAKFIDLEPTKGGVVNVLAEDVESFEARYLDAMTGEWTDSWDSSQLTSQPGRLPTQIQMRLTIKGGVGNKPISFETKVPISMLTPLSFATPLGSFVNGKVTK